MILAHMSSVFGIMHTFQAAVEEKRSVSFHNLKIQGELRDQPLEGCKAAHSSVTSEADCGSLISDETGGNLIKLLPPGTVGEDPLDQPARKARYRILVAHRSRHYSLFWPIRKKHSYRYVTVSRVDTDQDFLERDYPTSWPEQCDLLQKQYVEKYVERCWRKKAGWKFVAMLDPTCEQWQERLTPDEWNHWERLIKGEGKVKKSTAMPGRAKDRGKSVLFVLERAGGWEEEDDNENEHESILDEETNLCMAQEAVVVDGNRLRLTVREVKNES